MLITHKHDMYSLYLSGDLGNRMRTWALRDFDYPDDVSHVSLRVLGGIGCRCITGIPVRYVDVAVEELSHLNHLDLIISEDPPDMCRTLQGEFTRLNGGYSLEYTTVKRPMREALETGRISVEGFEVINLLKRHMDPDSFDWVMHLTEVYSDPYNVETPVVEFTCFDRCVGVIPRRNTIIWEVRSY